MADPENKSNNPEPAESLSGLLNSIISNIGSRNPTIGEIIHEIHGRGHMFVCLILSIPFLIPVPMPGISTVFGLVMILSSVQFMFNRDLWLPRKIRDRVISNSIVSTVLSGVASFLRKFEKIIYPRLEFIGGNLFSKYVSGVSIIVLAVLLGLPMPPGFNAPPALGIICLSVGHMQKDGLFVVLGWLLTILNILLFWAFFALGFAGLKQLLNLF